MEYEEWIKGIIEGNERLTKLQQQVMEAMQEGFFEHLHSLTELQQIVVKRLELKDVPRKLQKEALVNCLLHMGSSLVLTQKLFRVEDVLGSFPPINDDQYYQGRDTVSSFFMLYCLVQSFRQPYPDLARQMEKIMKDIFVIIKPCLQKNIAGVL